MKKVGIMSMQRIINYGSFLQAYSLKSTIEELGYNVEFVDYKVEPCIDSMANSEDKNDKSALYKYLRYIWNLRSKETRNLLKYAKFNKTFEEEYIPKLGVTNERNERPKLDALVIGSDEVFNCLQNNPNVGYSMELFGKDNNAKKLITYAACFGHTTVEGLKSKGKDKEISGLLNEFNEISVRDNNSGQAVKRLTGRDVIYNLDPVFIYNYDKLMAKDIDLKDFIIVYAYSGRISIEEVEKIKAFARKENKKLVSIGVYQNFCDMYITANPFDLLAYFKKADYVITDTFHGTVFSIKYNKQFVTIIRDSNREKLQDLLSRFSLSTREITDLNSIENIIKQPINYKEINDFIKLQTEKSREYLKANLQ